MNISKIKDVKTPIRGNANDAGIDFFVPNDFEALTVQPQGQARIGSGVRAEVPNNYALIAFNKSGVALSGLDIGACVIDEGYQGEINLHLFNPTDQAVTIQPGQKLAQFILIPMFYDTIVEVDDAELHTVESTRGDGAFGSTGNGLN
jgi:dUTP pyrophosphatase